MQPSSLLYLELVLGENAGVEYEVRTHVHGSDDDGGSLELNAVGGQARDTRDEVSGARVRAAQVKREQGAGSISTRRRALPSCTLGGGRLRFLQAPPCA
jgi:hypothetical protein